MNYQIITDEEALLSFIEWLPDLHHDETFYLCLFARSKYVTGITHVRSDKAQLKRFTSNKERLFSKIQQLECPVGSYMQKDTAMPQEALALYITINPRSFTKANTNSVKKLLDLALQPYNGFHPYQEVMSEIQKAKSRTQFVTFDFDMSKSNLNAVLGPALKCVGEKALSIVETRGGYHFIVEPKKINEESEKTWYQRMNALLQANSDDKDNAGDIMLPVPGTYQGGHTPKFINP